MKRIVLILSLTAAILAQAQEVQPYLLKLDEYVSFPSKTIYSIKKDEKGNLYAATENGLLRMKDQEVELFRAVGQKGRAVFNLNVDLNGDVWMSNLSQQLLRLSKDSLSVVSSLASQIDGGIPQINTESSELAVLQRERLYLKNEGQKFTEFNTPDPDVLRSNLVYHLDTWFFYQGNGLYKFDNDQIVLVDKYNYHDEVSGGIQLFRHANKWHIMLNIANEIKVFELGKREKLLKSFKEIKNLVVTNMRASEDEVFFCTSKGLFIYERENNDSYRVQNILKNRTVTDVLRDKNGFLWISTYKDGIYIMPDQSIKQIHLPNRSDYLITNILTSPEGLYFIVDDSRLHFQDKSGNFQIKDIKRRSDQKLISINGEEAFLINQNTYQLKDGVIKVKSSFPGVKDVDKVSSNYFIATYNKLIKTDLDFNVIEKKDGRTSQIEPLHSGKLIADFAGSLQVLNSKLELEQLLRFKGSSITPRKFKTVNSGKEVIILDENGRLLQVKYSKHEWITEEITVHGNQSIFDIRDFSIQANNLYILTDRGLIEKSLVDYRERRFDAQGTVKWNESDELHLSSDEFYVLMASQILKFPTSIFDRKTQAPFFTLSKPSIFKKDNSQRVITLPYHNRSLALEFSDNTIFPHNELIPLIKKNNEWVDYQTYNQSIINNLTAGNHQLEIRFQNRFTGASSMPIIIPLIISTPYFLEWWFIAVCFLGLAISLWLIYFLRGRFVKRKMQKEVERETREKNLTQLKLENLRSQMNPHFVFNSLNSLQDYILSNNKLLASSYLVRFSRLMRMYLTHSRRAFISLRSEVEALRLYVGLEKERYGDNFNFDLAIDKVIDLENTLIPSLLLQPYVENAITHGLHHKKGMKHLEISFSQAQGSGIKIVIEDNGVGRDRARELSTDTSHESFSMIANKSRLDLMNKYHNANLDVEINDLTDKKGEPLGTRVVINLSYINP